MPPKVAIVTGASSGIGLASAQRFAREGYHVVLVARHKGPLETAAQALRQEGKSVTVAPLDLGEITAVMRLPEVLGPLYHQVAVLVNNAAVSPKQNGKKIPISETSLDIWENALRVNLTAPLMLSQLVLRPMRKNRWGRIINVSSRAGRMPSGLPGIEYVTTKTGLIGLTRAIAHEVAEFGVTVNTVAPGRIRTPMGENINKEMMERIMLDVPLRRWGEPDEVAALISFLASKDAAYITGAVVDINGGVVMM